MTCISPAFRHVYRRLDLMRSSDRTSKLASRNDGDNDGRIGECHKHTTLEGKPTVGGVPLSLTLRMLNAFGKHPVHPSKLGIIGRDRVAPVVFDAR